MRKKFSMKKNFFECRSHPNKQKTASLVKRSTLVIEVTQETRETFNEEGK